MAKIEEIIDEHYSEQQLELIEDDDYSDTDSEITEDEDDFYVNETLKERIVALRDAIPPKQRAQISSSVQTTYSWVTSSLLFSGRALWVLSTGVLFLGVPALMALVEEQGVMEMEKEAKLQQSANELLTPGSTASTGESSAAL